MWRLFNPLCRHTNFCRSTLQLYQISPQESIVRSDEYSERTSLRIQSESNASPSALIVIAGNEYNVSIESLPVSAVLTFAQGRVIIPFVDRLEDNITPISYVPVYFTDNLVATAGILLAAAAQSYLADIQPHSGTRLGSITNPSNGHRTFTINQVLSQVHSIAFDFLPFSSGEQSPYPLHAYVDIPSLAYYGPVVPLCGQVSMKNIPSSRNTHAWCLLQHFEYIQNFYGYVKGTVTIGPPLLPSVRTFNNAYVGRILAERGVSGH